jgi:membrane protein implicated in regulation of membrane protease activity
MNGYDDLQRRQAYLRLTSQARLYGGLAVIALIIAVVNFLAVITSLWRPMGVLNLPVHLLFAVTALLAAVSFRRTRQRTLYDRDHLGQEDDDAP